MISPAAAARVRLVVLDIDGVMTDAGIYLGDVAGQRAEFKRYDIQDGVGLTLLRMSGIKLAIITGRESESVRLRAAELEVDAVVQDHGARKVPALRRIIAELGVTLEETAFVGDDLPDLGAMRLVGLAVAVQNATPEVRDAAHVTLSHGGGRGAVREFVEMLLGARGEWDALVERYVVERSREEVRT